MYGGRAVMFGHENQGLLPVPVPTSACLCFIVTIDSNEMFGNEAIHQGVDTLATCVQRALKRCPFCTLALFWGR